MDQGSKRIQAFRTVVLTHYAEHGRDLPWRRTHDPYRILVSEVMLQQTQVPRVIPKYDEFIEAFPDLESLAAAPLASVLRHWQGLGYNRRALALKRTAEIVVAEHAGRLPRDVKALRGLPGIGPATAAALAAFAFGEPHPILETNIRAAFLHHFFPEAHDVPDSELLPLVEATLDREDPRTWYYALMDYGSMLKRTAVNPSRRSRHHVRQSAFEGSRRQLRASVLRAVLDRPGARAKEVAPLVERSIPAVRDVLGELEREGFLKSRDGRYEPAEPERPGTSS